MIKHEYGDRTIFFFTKEDDALCLIAMHLKVLFRKAAQHSNRSRLRVLFDSVVSILPRRSLPGLVDERNSVGIALDHECIEHISALDAKLGSIVDTTARETNFGFSEEEISHVCATDSMAALAFATSRSGYVREIGLSCIDDLGPEIGLSIVILRLNDWVPEVRAAAVRAIERLMESSGDPIDWLPFVIADSIGLLLDEKRFNRMSENERRTKKSLIEYPGVEAAVRHVFIHDRTSRLTSQNLQISIRTGFCDEMLPEIATKAECSHRRLIAVRAILGGRHVWKREVLVDTRELDFEGHREAIVKSALLDKSANVAFSALGYLIKSEDFSSLDDDTIGQLSTRSEASLQRRTRILLDRISGKN